MEEGEVSDHNHHTYSDYRFPTTLNQVNELANHYYPISSHTHSIGGNHNMVQTSPNSWQAKEKPLSTLDKIKQERIEARERGKIEKAYDAYDKKRLSELGDGAVLRFATGQVGSERIWAAVGYRLDGEQRWSTTGSYSPKNCSTEDLIAWLIEKKVPATKVRVLQG